MCRRGVIRNPSCLAISASHRPRSARIPASTPSGISTTRSLRRSDLADDRVHLLQIARLGDHKLELIRIKLDQPPQNLGLITQALMLIGPAAVVARVRRRIGELRADAHQIAADVRVHRARGLDGDVLRRAARSVLRFAARSSARRR